jgi:hypothetical protein
MYKLIKGINSEVFAVLRLADNAQVPFDPANTDYQAYLKWLEEGGVPTPADEVTA